MRVLRASPIPCSSPSGTVTMCASIQITMAEDFGVQDRGGFYDETGAMRDVVQNHMLQVMANLMMDPPTGEESRGGSAIRGQRC